MMGITHPISWDDRMFIRPRSRSRHDPEPSMRWPQFTESSSDRRGDRAMNIGYGYGNDSNDGLAGKISNTHRGTSLVELLVVLALLSVMILVGAQLVVHSMELLGATGRAVSNPLVVHVTSRLRHDVQEAAGLLRQEPIWSEEPLVLITNDGRFVSIGREGGNLVRIQMTAIGATPDRRVILRGVTAWWWRTPVRGVVDLNVTYLVNPEPERQSSREVGYGLERRQENLRFAIRGGGGGTRW